jgi:hypothetical protein
MTKTFISVPFAESFRTIGLLRFGVNLAKSPMDQARFLLLFRIAQPLLIA